MAKFSLSCPPPPTIEALSGKRPNKFLINMFNVKSSMIQTSLKLKSKLIAN